ncbi:MAG: type II toxin-antitoxin system ParD family antitoxin [Sneathiellaceae bacterium]
MGKPTSVMLGDHFEQLVATEVAAGRYASASEVIRDGLRLVEERRQRLDALDRAIDAGLASGIDEAFSWESVKRRGKARTAASKT